MAAQHLAANKNTPYIKIENTIKTKAPTKNAAIIQCQPTFSKAAAENSMEEVSEANECLLQPEAARGLDCSTVQMEQRISSLGVSGRDSPLPQSWGLNVDS